MLSKHPFDVSLQHPFRRVLSPKRIAHLFDCVCRRAPTAETVGVSIAGRLGCRIERQQVQRLHGPVAHGRDAQGASVTICFRDVDPSHRLRLCSPCGARCRPPATYRPEYSMFAGRSPGVLRPWFSVTRLTASAFALMERVRSLCRRLTLRHSPCLCCFRDSCLQPPDHLMRVLPRYVVPVRPVWWRQHRNCLRPYQTSVEMERAMGIEPTLSAYGNQKLYH